MSSVAALRWGIVGTGEIAHEFAGALALAEHGSLVAVGSREAASADAFGAQFGIERRHAGYQDLVDDPQVDAVYIATPHAVHAQWAIRAARAGKHVLCEKPLALNYAEAMAIADAAEHAGVALLEAFMYRFHPQTVELLELVAAGAIGELRLIEASYGHALLDVEPDAIADPAVGGGGILDLGCYCVHVSRLLAGAAHGRPYLDPTTVTGAGMVGEHGTDEYAAAVLSFDGAILAQIACGVRLGLGSSIRVVGSQGEIQVPRPAWLVNREAATGARLVVKRNGADPETLVMAPTPSQYALEADALARAASEPGSWSASRGDALGNMRALDAWREAVGVSYPAELPRPTTITVAGSPLTAPVANGMPTERVDGVAIPVSRLVLGSDFQPGYAHAAVMFDHYFEHGGTMFDTAHNYADATLLGEWIAARSIRDRVAILAKGAARPECDPHWVRPQLEETLEQLQTDHVDVYMLHSDNPRHPVGDFLEVLNALKAEGIVRTFGASNWTLERVLEAERYARENGLDGFAAISNQFSLAEMIDPIWEGSVSAFGPAWREWLTSRDIPLMPWSTLARSFLVRARDEASAHPQIVRCWHSPENLARRDRLRRLADEKGVAPAAIGIAYVLRQPFPTFPLIGPRSLSELRATLTTLDISLTDAEIAFLQDGETAR